MLWAFLGSVRPSFVCGAWVAFGAGADFVPVRLVIVAAAALVAGTTAKAVRAADDHHKVVLIRTIIRLARELDLQPALRRVKLPAAAAGASARWRR